MARFKPTIIPDTNMKIKSYVMNSTFYAFTCLKLRRFYKQGGHSIGPGVIGMRRGSYLFRTRVLDQLHSFSTYKLPFQYILWTVSSTFKYRFVFPHKLCRWIRPLPFTYEEDFASLCDRFNIDLVSVKDGTWAPVDWYPLAPFLVAEADFFLGKTGLFFEKELLSSFAFLLFFLTF